MARIRTTSYDLISKERGYERLVEALKQISVSQKVSKDYSTPWDEFVMPRAQVVISLNNRRDLDGIIRMNVQRTTLTEPRYVKQIVKKFNGKWSSSRNFTEKSVIDLYFGK